MDDSEDSGSGSGGSLLDTVTNLVGKGADVYKSVTASGNRASDPTATNTAARQAATTNNQFTQYLPWIGGGLAILLVIGLIFRK